MQATSKGSDQTAPLLVSLSTLLEISWRAHRPTKLCTKTAEMHLLSTLAISYGHVGGEGLRVGTDKNTCVLV